MCVSDPGLEKEFLDNRDSYLSLYQEAEQDCRAYSPLTQNTRSQSNVAVLAFAGAMIGLVITRGIEGEHIGVAMMIGGVALLYLALASTAATWHYQKAFEAVRDYAAALEPELFKKPFNTYHGPRSAHRVARTKGKDHLASYGPYALLAIMGLGCLGWGSNMHGQSLMQAYCSLSTCFFYWILPILSGLAGLGCAWWFYGTRPKAC